MENKLTIAEFKRIRWRIALALQTQARFVFIDTVETTGNGFRKVKVSVKGYSYIAYMNGDTVTQMARDINTL